MNFSRNTSGTAERGAGFAPGLVDGFIELLGLVGDAHAAAAAAHGRLDDHRIAELLGQLARLLALARSGFIAAGQHGHVGLLGDVPGRQLVAELLEHLDARPDEDDAGLGRTPRRSAAFSERKP